MNIADHDSRQRDERKDEYSLVTGKEGSGRVVCYREGMRLGDFYRTPAMLIKDYPTYVKRPVEGVEVVK